MSNRSFGEDYRGDLKSHRLINQLQNNDAECEDQSELIRSAVRIG
jgi:hypothetical protein